MRRKYGAMISAALLALQLGERADAQESAPDLIELRTIFALLDANDVDGLRTYLRLNPELTEGESDLARLLRQYVERSEDLNDFLGVSTISDADADDADVPVETAPVVPAPPELPVITLY